VRERDAFAGRACAGVGRKGVEDGERSRVSTFPFFLLFSLSLFEDARAERARITQRAPREQAPPRAVSQGWDKKGGVSLSY